MINNKNCYTDGLNTVCIIHKHKEVYLVKDKSGNMFLLSDINGYRPVSDKRTIKDWYEDSKKYAKEHPLSALIAAFSVFFGLTQF